MYHFLGNVHVTLTFVLWRTVLLAFLYLMGLVFSQYQALGHRIRPNQRRLFGKEKRRAFKSIVHNCSEWGIFSHCDAQQLPQIYLRHGAKHYNLGALKCYFLYCRVSFTPLTFAVLLSCYVLLLLSCKRHFNICCPDEHGWKCYSFTLRSLKMNLDLIFLLMTSGARGTWLYRSLFKRDGR